MKSRDIVQIALIAALYMAVTLIFYPISFHVVQIRVSEALTVLPFLFPNAIPGLTIGVFLANFVGGFGLVDMVFGSLATLIAALMTSRMPSPYLAPLPPVIVNALIVGGYLSVLTGMPLWVSILHVGGGQLISCYVLGLPLLYGLQKIK